MGSITNRAALRTALSATAAFLSAGVPNVAAAAQSQGPVEDTGASASRDQATAESGESPERDGPIVVTGTLIRNTAPTGTNPIEVSTADIEATGATSGSEVLASIPQITGSFFNNIPQVQAINATAVAGFNQTTSRPSLRPNPFGGTDTGNATLILIDGVRQAGIGVNGSSANPDSVPPALIQRIDVNPDGASSIYGSDAIGGVINFITRRKFDGIQIGGSIGLRDHYTSYDANITAGTDWGSGGAYVGYAYSSNDLLLNSQIDYYNPLDFSTGLQRDLSCDPPNVQVNAAGAVPIHYYSVGASGTVGAPFTVVPSAALPSLVGTPNVCSLGINSSLASANERHHALARVTQDLSDDITVGLRLRYIWEDQYGLVAPSTYSNVVNSTNPFFQRLAPGAGPFAGDAALNSYTVRGSLLSVQGDRRRFQNRAEQWGAMADLSWNIGKWRLLAVANFDWSKSSYSNPAVNPTVLASGFNNSPTSACSIQRSAAACFNPYNIDASNPALLAALTDYHNIGRGTDQIINFRAVFDGPLFELPGGEVKAAVGAEYLKDKFRKGIYTGVDPNALVQSGVVQTDKAVFGEINVPLFSEQNAMPLFQALSLNAQGRYDHFSDFGGTFNPRFGASWSPVRWLTIRGNWGKTFRAPTTVDLLGTSVANTRLTSAPANVFGGFLLSPAQPIVNQGAQAISLQGTNPDIGPQRGRNWSVGADLTPMDGLKASITYYRIFFQDLLASPANGTPIFPNLAHIATICPVVNGVYACTEAQRAAFRSLAGVSAVDTIATSDIYGFYDARVDNLGNARVAGLDWSVQYSHPMTWGRIYGSLNGAVLLKSESQALPGQPYIDNLAPGNQAGTQSFGRSTHRISGRAGIEYDNIRAQVIWNHNSGYDVVRSATLLQDKVGAFDVFNLFLSYEFADEGILGGLKLTLNVDNVFDTSPPEYRSTNSEPGYINGSTLGRFVRLGFEKKF